MVNRERRIAGEEQALPRRVDAEERRSKIGPRRFFGSIDPLFIIHDSRIRTR